MGIILILISAALLHFAVAGKNDCYKGMKETDTPLDAYWAHFFPYQLWSSTPSGVVTEYTVHSVELSDRSHSKLLQRLEIEMDLDTWQYGAVGQREAIIMVSPENRVAFLDLLDEHGLKHYLYLNDVVEALDKHDEEVTHWKQSRMNLVPFEDYPQYAEVDAYLERIAREYPNLVTLVNSGPSFEGRPVKYLKISTTNFEDHSKPVYFIDAMIHAREWVTTPVALYTIHRLVEDLRDSERDLLENTDWIILPIVNPDGYEYTHTDMRLWRRTRSFNPAVSENCYGVDGNRNFNYSWAEFGVSSDPCSDIYPGPEPFSEVEIRYVRDILHEYVDRIQLYLDIHSFGNYVLFPYGEGILPTNAAQIHHIGSLMGASIDAHKLPIAGYYIVGNSGLVLYPASGCADDYAQSVGVPMSLCLELPAYGFDFRVPPSYIEQINKETWEGIVVSARLALQHYKARIQNF